ncbi:hypothetical protein IEO70_08750 [Bacillus sp. AGMB 02131]|uniref:Uncharacterized protein n=1 Tax=Peribacillus faecalis TaxID=2772559 RepID=A0A927CWI0_9BACI|nr:hypothetical protein [Peribacillus faecalis]MBD3108454.1 hypothetical protein [Peribacillus faecalis]
MKFTRLISFAVIGVLSVGTLVTVAEVNKAPVDRVMEIEDLTGDRSVLDGVTLENVIKTDENAFEKVYLKNEDVVFEKTEFDLRHGVGEEVLRHKDLYRGMNNALKAETDAVIFIARFNSLYPYASNDPFVELAVKNKSTNEIMKEKVTVPDLKMSESIYNESVLEIDGKIYYCLALGDMNGNSAKQSIKIYEVNQKTLQLQVVNVSELSLDGDYANSTNIIALDNNIYTIAYNDREYKLAMFNPATKDTEIINLSSLSGMSGYIQFFDMNEQTIFLQTEEKMLIIDRDTDAIVNEDDDFPSFAGDYEYVYSTEHIMNDKLIYVLYGTYTGGLPSDQLLVAYDVKDGSLIYGGKLPSMADRGVGINYSFYNN